MTWTNPIFDEYVADGFDWNVRIEFQEPTPTSDDSTVQEMTLMVCASVFVTPVGVPLALTMRLYTRI